MKSDSSIHKRKSDHIMINLTENVKSSNTTGLEKFRLIHNAIPEIDLEEVDTSIVFFEKRLSFPFIISSMTGGTPETFDINKKLAKAAQKYQIGMGVGSQRIGIEQKVKMKTFKIREYAPDILLFANLGAIQLNNSFTVDDCKAAVHEIEADALLLHLNTLQEALMEDGNTNFNGLLKKIEQVCKNIGVPIIAKEVGWGISPDAAKRLISAGVSAIDVAGSGGTSWSEVEKHRVSTRERKWIAEGFRDWGIPTADAVIDIRKEMQEIPIIASGGIRSGIDIVKCLALGANMCGIAHGFLTAAMGMENELDDYIEAIAKQIQIAMFAIGTADISQINSNIIKKK